MSVIAPCRSNPKTTVASPNPEHRIVQANYQGIREITGSPPNDLRPPLHPTTRPLTGNDLEYNPGAGAAGGPPEGEAQGIAEELAVLAGAGSRRWVWLDLDATTGQGNAGEQGGTGGVIGIGGDPDALGSRSLARLEPICQGRDLGGDEVARGQRISGRSPAPAATATGNARSVLGGWVPSSTTIRSAAGRS